MHFRQRSIAMQSRMSRSVISRPGVKWAIPPDSHRGDGIASGREFAPARRQPSDRVSFLFPRLSAVVWPLQSSGRRLVAMPQLVSTDILLQQQETTRGPLRTGFSCVSPTCSDLATRSSAFVPFFSGLRVSLHGSVDNGEAQVYIS